MKILITGFEPFNGESVNPSWQAVNAIPEIKGAVEIIKAELPVSFKQAAEQVYSLMEEHQPDVLLMVGQAGGQSGVTCERVGLNMADTETPDCDGFQPDGIRIVKDGPDAYFSTLPVKEIVEHIKSAGIPAKVSNSAGTFVCNTVLYTALHLVKLSEAETYVGLMHLPYLPQQVVNKKNTPSMSLETMVSALEVAINTIVSKYQ